MPGYGLANDYTKTPEIWAKWHMTAKSFFLCVTMVTDLLFFQAYLEFFMERENVEHLIAILELDEYKSRVNYHILDNSVSMRLQWHPSYVTYPHARQKS